MSEAESANNGVYFLSLELENVRCFKKQELKLFDSKDKNSPARWTVILGNNGTGKTTLLKVLASMELDAKLKFPDESFTFKILNQAESFIRKTSENFNIAVELAYNSNFKDNNFSKERIPKDPSIDPIHGIQTWTSVKSSTLKKIPYFKCYGYGATRRLNKSSLYQKKNTDTTATLFDEKAELIDAEEWILRKDYAASKESIIQVKTKQQLDLVKDILKKILPDVENIDIFPPDENNPNPLLVFETPMGYMQLKDLSLGYQSMIAWVVDLAACLFERYPNSPNPIAEAAVVLIDEIDLHLHPKWQREIMRYLSERFINTQFIVTAHSPLIVQAAEDENANIVVLRREGDEVIIDQQPKAINGWRVDQLLASDLFGLEGSRSPKSEERLKERDEILNKPELTETDKKRLEELRYIPMAESPEDIEAMSIIREAAQLLKEKYK